MLHKKKLKEQTQRKEQIEFTLCQLVKIGKSVK
jgi:hypothetical protein